MVELLISTALFSVMAGSIYLLYTTMQSTMTYGELKADLQQNARVGLAQMTQELLNAGYDPDGAIPLVTLQPKAAIRAATPTCLSVVSFLMNPTSGAEESKQITHEFDSSAKILRRRVQPWNGSSDFLASTPQPLAEFVESLTFTYYDADNQVLPATSSSTRACPPDPVPLTVAIPQLDYYQMRQVRRVTILLQTKKLKQPGVSTDQFYTLTSDVRIRNR